MTPKIHSFEWNPEQKKKALKQVQAAVQDAPPLGPHDPAAPMVPEALLWQTGMLCEAFGR